MNGEARTAGFLHNQPLVAGAEPWSIRRHGLRCREGLTAASTGTPSDPEEPRQSKINNLFTQTT
jgi:hypothetical protein